MSNEVLKNNLIQNIRVVNQDRSPQMDIDDNMIIIIV